MVLSQDKNMAEAKDTLTVLVADDDTPTRILLRAAISQWGYTVVEAKDGEEAWDIMQHPAAPRLLIVDWLMPKLNGIELCERVKREVSQFSYIILLTQQVGTTNIIKGLEAGADEFLSKPFNMAELRSRLSIGNRIISYELMLMKQHDRLKGYVHQLDSLLAQASTLTKEISESKTPQDQNEKINTLKTVITTISSTIKKYKQENEAADGIKV